MVGGMRIRRGFRGTVAAITLATLAVVMLPAMEQAAFATPATSAPFTECPKAGSANTCGILIIFEPNGTTTILGDSHSGNPYEGSDDTTVGVYNRSGSAVPSVTLNSSTVDPFGFDGDGMCQLGTGSTKPAGCLFDTNTSHPGYGYAGPGITYTGISSNKRQGVVNFSKSCNDTGGSCVASTGLSSGSTVFFSLENNLNAASFTIPKATPTITTNATGGSAGDSISDSATLAGGNAPTGTITFKLYKGACPGTLVTGSTSTAPVSGNGTYNSAAVPVATAGTYNWVASYDGDGNNNGVSSTCGQETVNVGKATTTLSTKPKPVSGGVGGSYADEATLSGGSSPTGNITFKLYKGECPGTAAFTSTKPIGNGTVSSDATTLNDAGTYNWVASYEGDANNKPFTTECGDETVTVKLAGTTLTTSPNMASGPAGGSYSDSATVSGGASPTGTITFYLYRHSDTHNCTDLLFTSANKPLSSGTANSDATTLNAGTYEWVASYSGDAKNAASSSECGDETVTVNPAEVTLTTTPKPASGSAGGSYSDDATLNGGASPTGSITFKLYAGTTCMDTGTNPVFTATKTVTANGTYNSGPKTLSTAGTYNWVVHYSGDANNAAADSTCGNETVTVTPGTKLSTTPRPSEGSAGGSYSDDATLSGGVAPHGGSITFKLYAGTTCTDTVTNPVFTATKTVTANGTYNSGAKTLNVAGTYNWVVSYSGDAKNAAVKSKCRDEEVTVNKARTTVRTDPEPESGPVGGSFFDKAILSGGALPKETITFTLYNGGGNEGPCTGSVVFTSTKTVNGNGTYSSEATTLTTPGTYSWIASYSGDANNKAFTSDCDDEVITVKRARTEISTTPNLSSGTVGGNFSDSATLSDGFSPTGTITFSLYKGTSCTGDPVFNSVKTVSGGNGTYTSGSYQILTAGTFEWVASYSGDNNNKPSNSFCGDEEVTVNKAPTTISTAPVPSKGLDGDSYSDNATLSDGFSPTGSIVFNLYSGTTCTPGTEVFTSTKTVSGNGTYNSGPTTLNTAGTYNWVATYSGDANNKSSTSECGDETIKVFTPVMTGRAYALSASGILTVPPIPDTGNVSTTTATSSEPPCIATVALPPSPSSPAILVHALCANVSTFLTPRESIANASVADATINVIPGNPIVLGLIQSSSTTDCNGSSGSTTIAFLKIGSNVIIPSPSPIPPNSTIPLGIATIILNEQIPITGAESGLTVNAIHIKVPMLQDIVLASSESDISGCPS